MSKNTSYTNRCSLLLVLTTAVAINTLIACTDESTPAGRTFDVEQNNTISATMKYIDAGTFTMGSSSLDASEDEKPPHEVCVDAFYIDECEVTNAEYREFVLATDHRPPFSNRQWADPFAWDTTNYPAHKADYPVVLVSWNDANAYCSWKGKRLPTEAEWEKAARGGLHSMPYPCGSTLKHNEASYFKGYIRGKKMYPVCTFKPNAYGLFDMAGNVWEWCSDWYQESYYQNSPNMNPCGPAKGLYKIFRGGSWRSDKKYLRCSKRGKNIPEYISNAVGFRCAVSAKHATNR